MLNRERDECEPSVGNWVTGPEQWVEREREMNADGEVGPYYIPLPLAPRALEWRTSLPVIKTTHNPLTFATSPIPMGVIVILLFESVILLVLITN